MENSCPELLAVVVLGGAGFIGSHLCQALKESSKYARVISVDNYSTGSAHNHHGGVEYRKGNVVDVSDIVPETPAIVFHLAEFARAEQSFERACQVVTENISSTCAVADFCVRRGCKLVYGGSSTRFSVNGRDQSPYAFSKATNADLVKRYGEWFQLRYAIAYFYNVYGPGERSDAKTGTVVGIFRDQYERGVPMTLRLPATQKRHFTHVLDVVSGLLLIAERGEGDGFGLGHSKAYSINHVANMFFDPSGPTRSVKFLPNRPGNRVTLPPADVLSTQSRAIGWKPTHNLPDYVADIVAHHNAAQNPGTTEP